MTPYLQVEKLTKSFGDLVLFQQISFGIAEGQRIGLIAKNGSGKTTLLNILSGKEGYDEGKITFRRDLRLGYLEQSPVYPGELTVLEACFHSENPALKAIAEYERAIEEPSGEGLQEAMARMDALEAWDYEQRAKRILSRLKIRDFGQRVGTLSGGQLKRVALANALISESDLLILDDLFKDALEANSPLVRDNAWEWYNAVARTRLHNGSQELIVGTRWHEEDLPGRIAAHERVVGLTDFSQLGTLPPDCWLMLNFEAIKESPPTPADPRDKGEALWPARHSRALLDARRRLDPHLFEALYQGRPASKEGLLYGEGFATYDELPATVVKRGNYTDTADTGDDYLCSLCYAVGGDGMIYLTDALYTPEPMEATEPQAAAMLRRADVREALFESNNGGRGFARAVGRLVPEVRIAWTHQSRNKEARILSNSATVQRLARWPRGWEARWPELARDLLGYRRLYRANRRHDAPDALTGVVETELDRSRRTIRAVGFRSPER